MTQTIEQQKADSNKAQRIAEYEARRAAKAERYQTRAANAHQEAERRFKAARAEVAGIPFGQPILVGHHSESRHRAALKRHDNNMRKGCEAFDKAKHYARRAETAATEHSISSDDPAAIDKLRARIAELEHNQEVMKAANVALRKGDDAALVALGLSATQIAEIKKPYLGRTGFQSFTLSNNSANIRRLKDRLKRLEKNVKAEPIEKIVHGVRVFDNVEENRLQLFFEGKPADEIRAALKSRGFRWSPRFGAWQRQRGTNANYAAECVLKLLT